MSTVPDSPSVKGGEADGQVRQLLMEYLRSVERHDLPTFLSFFQQGDHFTVFEDREMYTWPAFVTFAEGFFKTVAEISFDLEGCSVDSVAPGVAVATGVFKGTGRTTAGEPVAVRNAFTFVLGKNAGRWLIRHVHESSLGA